MKVLITAVYDANDEAEAAEISKQFPAIPGVMYTRDNFTVFDRNALLNAAKGAALAQYRAHIHSACVPSQRFGAEDAETIKARVIDDYMRILSARTSEGQAVLGDVREQILNVFKLPAEHTTVDHTLDDVSAKNIRKAFS